jgi:hypothetical protein
MTATERNAARPLDGRDTPEAETTEFRAAVAAPETESTEIELRLDDLIGDENEETVLYNDSGARVFRLVADHAVVAEGHVERHLTAGGANVTGFRYMRFANGLTIYYADGLNLLVHGADRAAGP